MKISIITVCYNSASTIADAIGSINDQRNVDIEHIIVDGASTDRTVQIAKSLIDQRCVLISEPDRGIYDAMNKGLARATGDVIGFLNADDFYCDNSVLEQVIRIFDEKGVDSVFGDLVYVSPEDIGSVLRRWRSEGRDFVSAFWKGWHPPHPAFFVRKSVIERYGVFDLSYSIAADYEMMLRLLVKQRITVAYLPKVLVKMRTGGASNRSISNVLRANIECRRAWIKNNLRPPFLLMMRKPFYKLIQFF